MFDEERGYVVTCPKGHQTALRFSKDEVRKALKEDALKLWCQGCRQSRAPTPEERSRLKQWAES